MKQRFQRDRFISWKKVLMPLVCILVISICASVAAHEHECTSGCDCCKYDQVLSTAEQELKYRNFRRARELFFKAYELKPGGQSLRGMGITSLQLQEAVESVRYLSASLIEEREPLTRDQKIEVVFHRMQAKRYIGSYQVMVYPKEAQVTLDGEPLRREIDGSVLLGMGAHQLEAYYQNHRTVKRNFEVRGGEDMEIHLILMKDTQGKEFISRKWGRRATGQRRL